MSFIDELPIYSALIKSKTRKCPNLSLVHDFIINGWPDKVDERLEPYFSRRTELTVEQGVVLWGMRVIITECLQYKVLQETHDEHIGV